MHGPVKSSLLLLAAISIQAGAPPPDRVWQGGSAPTAVAGCDLKVVSWNIERGEQLAEISTTLVQLHATVALLQEVDMNAKRTRGTNVAEHLAQRLGLNYVFAAEFDELGQHRGEEPAYHGQAIVTALAISSPRIIRFASQTGFWRPRWYTPKWAMFQRRAGGRLALVAELAAAPRPIVAYNVHLESHGDETLRLAQIEEVIADAQRYPAETPILLAGDFNTRQPAPPALDALLRAGFRKAVGQEPTASRGAALDWIFVRGPLRFADGIVHRQVRASDHFPLTARITRHTPDCSSGSMPGSTP